MLMHIYFFEFDQDGKVTQENYSKEVDSMSESMRLVMSKWNSLPDNVNTNTVNSFKSHQSI